MSASYTNFYEEDRRLRWKQSVVALAFAILIHLGVIFALPEQLMPVHRVAEERESVVYEIDLVEEPEEQRFVEANPDAPVNEPDRSDQYSFRAQQAADQNPLSDAANQPTVDGEEDSQKIIQGQLEQLLPLQPGVYLPEAQPGEGEGTDGGKLGVQAAPAPVPAQPLPAPDFLQQKPVSTDGPGSRVDLVGEAEEVFEEVVPDAPINVYRPPASGPVQVQEGDGAGGVPEARPMPRARPRLAPELLTGPLMKSQGSARQRGDLAIDATFSEFGEYEQQLYAAIQTGWYQEIEFYQPLDTATRVHVRFRIRADGAVDQVQSVDTTASLIATKICENAIIKRSPFRSWTREMVQVFGSERWLNVVFHYR